MKIDKSIIKKLSDYLDEFNLTEIEITDKDTKSKFQKIMYLLTINQSLHHQIHLIESNKLLINLSQNLELKLLHQLSAQPTTLQSLEQKNLLR